MIRIISVAFVLALASSSSTRDAARGYPATGQHGHAVVAGCGVGMTRVTCLRQHHKRQARRCARWNERLARNTTEPTRDRGFG